MSHYPVKQARPVYWCLIFLKGHDKKSHFIGLSGMWMGLFINSITSAEMRCVCVLPSMKAKHCHAMYYSPFRGLNMGLFFRVKEIKDQDIQLFKLHFIRRIPVQNCLYSRVEKNCFVSLSRKTAHVFCIYSARKTSCERNWKGTIVPTNDIPSRSSLKMG